MKPHNWQLPKRTAVPGTRGTRPTHRVFIPQQCFPIFLWKRNAEPSLFLAEAFVSCLVLTRRRINTNHLQMYFSLFSYLQQFSAKADRQIMWLRGFCVLIGLQREPGKMVSNSWCVSEPRTWQWDNKRRRLRVNHKQISASRSSECKNRMAFERKTENASCNLFIVFVLYSDSGRWWSPFPREGFVQRNWKLMIWYYVCVSKKNTQ